MQPVTDPDILKQLESSSREPVTDPALLEQLETLPAGGAVEAVAEPLLAIGGGAANMSRAGYGAIREGVQSGDFENFDFQGSINRSLESAPDFAPQTRAGQKGLQTIADLSELGVDIARFPLSGLFGLSRLIQTGDMSAAADMVRKVQGEGVGKVMADEMFENTGSPTAAAATLVAPEAVGTVLGLKGARAMKPEPPTYEQLIGPDGEITAPFRKQLQKKDILSGAVSPDEIYELPPGQSPKQATRSLIDQRLEKGSGDKALAPYKAGPKGFVDDDFALEALKQGFEKGEVQAIKLANAETKAAMLEMTNASRDVHTNRALETEKRPSDVVGASAMKRFRYIRAKANRDRSELNEIAANELPGKQIDTTRVEKLFFKELDGIGVKVDRSTIPPKLDFQGSDIAKDRTSQRVIKDVTDLLGEDGPVDALRAHKLKRQLDAMIDFRKKSKDGLTETGRNFAKSIRHELNQTIRAVSSRYAEVNDRLSMELDALNAFDDVVGSQINLFDRGADSAVGTKARILLSNYSNRVNLDNAINQLDDVARELGADFKDDIKHLVTFDNVLNTRFGASARGSFQGNIDAALKRSRQAARGAGGMKEAAADMVFDAINDMRGINDDNAYIALEKLLKRQDR